MAIHIRSIALLFFLIIFGSAQSFAQSFRICAYDDSAHMLESFDSCFITHVSYACDSALSEQEFSDLIGMRGGISITRDDVCAALSTVFRKNKFHAVVIELTPEMGGVHMHWIFESEWTFADLKIKGIWVGRDWYRQHYMMEPGDIFDQHKHDHSIAKIIEACKQDGFFDVSIESEYVRDEVSKSVHVTLHVAKGSRFTIDDITIEILADESVSLAERALIHDAVYEKHLKKIRKQYYAKPLLQERARAIKRYAVHKGFLSASIDLLENVHHATKRVSVQWCIDLHKKRNFVFFGNSFFTNAQLLDRMLQFGRSAWILPASFLAEELMNVYRAQGFWNIAIDAREEQGRSFFVIKEGPRAWIERIVINADRIPSRAIIRACFSQFRRGAYFDQKDLDHAFDDVVALYAQRGYLNARILDHEYCPGSKPNCYALTITIDEGEHTVYSSIRIPGFEELTSLIPYARNASLATPQLLDASMIHEQKRWLLSYFHARGFWHAVIKSETVPNEYGYYTLTWHIIPGEKIVFGKTIVQGAQGRSYEYVMRELQYDEGEVWSQERIHRTFTRLKDLQLFDFISFTPLTVDEQGARPLLLKVHHDDPFEIRLRAGLELQHIQQYQTFNGLAYRVGGTLIAKNVTDHADQFRADIDYALSHHEITLKYWYPWIFSMPCNALMQGYSIKYDQPGFIGSSKNIYTVYQNGFLWGLRHKNMRAELGLDAGFEVARTTLSDSSRDTCELASCIARALDLNPEIIGRRIPFFFFEPTAVLDRLDNKLNPRSGTFSLVSLKGMFPLHEQFRNAYFVKILAEHSWFVSLQACVAAFRVRIGHLFHRVFSDIIPSERFYLGGAHSIRSYEADLAPPLGCCILPDGNRLVLPRGGKTMFNANIELRIPVVHNVHGAVFQDIGVLSGDALLHDAGANFSAGTGCGIRYITPIGPLRFDVAWKWKKNVPEEGLFNWFLTFGQAF